MTDQQNTDLLPCPFCGGDDLRGDTTALDARYVECRKCGTFGPNHEDGLSWNTRADLAPKVKPLIWHEDKKGSHTACPPEWRRCYVIVEFSMVVRWKYGVLGKWHDVDSLEAAKAEVQADYEHRMEPAIGMGEG